MAEPDQAVLKQIGRPSLVQSKKENERHAWPSLTVWHWPRWQYQQTWAANLPLPSLPALLVVNPSFALRLSFLPAPTTRQAQHCARSNMRPRSRNVLVVGIVQLNFCVNPVTVTLWSRHCICRFAASLSESCAWLAMDSNSIVQLLNSIRWTWTVQI